MNYAPKLADKKTKLNWTFIEDKQCHVCEIKPLGWVFLIDGWNLKDKWIPCLQYLDEKEEAEVCLCFTPVSLKVAKTICQKKFDNHIKKIIKYFV